MINLVIAMRCEARPVIEHFGLTAARGTPFAIYSNRRLRLVVAGVGKAAAAAATGFLYGVSGARADEAWINVGVAGHASLPIGHSLLADTVCDQASDRRYYPPLVFSAPCDTGAVLTVDAVQCDYHDAWAFEMEASGFYAAAKRFSTAELIHCLKIVSDGPATDLSKLTAARITQLVGDSVPVLDRLLQSLGPLVAELAQAGADPPLFALLTERYSLTVTQSHQLRRLLQRLAVFCGGASGVEQQLHTRLFGGLRDAKQLLRVLRQETEQRALAHGSVVTAR